MRLVLAATTLCGFALASCGGEPTTTPPVEDGANTNPLCQPIATGNCFLPFPSSFYEKADSSSETGFRVSIPKGALPKNQVGEDFDPVKFNLLNGWSPSSQILADFGPAVRVDGSKLVGERDDWSKTLQPDSLTQILEYDTGARVPVFAEVDANVNTKPGAPTDEEQSHVLLVHPMARLKPATRYVVALQKLVDKNGKAIVVKPFQSLVAGQLADGGRLQALKPRYDEIFAKLESAGVHKADLTLAWDFVTASDKEGYGHVLTMRDAAFKRWAKDGLGYTVTSSKDVMNEPTTVREIEGTFDVPCFLQGCTPDDLFTNMNTDAAGNPVDTGKNYPASFLLHVPACAKTATEPLPILVYGHGNFGSRVEINGGDDRETMNALCMVEVATDWIGQADGDEARFGAKAPSFDKVDFLFDRMQQGQVNTLMLARVAAQKFPSMKELVGLPGTPLDGKPLVDGKNVYYYGNSQGGIYGATFLTMSPEVKAGVLGVGATNYSVMIWRSRDFETEKDVMDYVYPNLAEQQILWMLAQSLWDRVDPIAFVAHTVKDPLPDETGAKMAPKRVLYQIGRYDEQVPNVATGLGARTMGIPLLAPAVEPVYGLEAKMAPLDSAYVMFDVHAEPVPPATNTPADKGDAKGEEPHGTTGPTVHEAVRRLPEAIEQMKRFLKPDGKVENTCVGVNMTCDYPKK